MGASRNRRKVILATEVAVRLGLVFAFLGNLVISSNFNCTFVNCICAKTSKYDG